MIEQRYDLILQKYNKALAQKGIMCNISKKEIKSKVINFFSIYGILNYIFRVFTVKREEKLYKNKPDKYSVLILTFSSLTKDAKTMNPKSYAFITDSVTRIGKGFAPEEKIYDEEKIANGIEKRIAKALKKAEKHPAKKICESSFADNLRYLFSAKYEYKKTVFGKSRETLELILVLAFFVLVAVVAAISIFLK